MPNLRGETHLFIVYHNIGNPEDDVITIEKFNCLKNFRFNFVGISREVSYFPPFGCKRPPVRHSQRRKGGLITSTLFERRKQNRDRFTVQRTEKHPPCFDAFVHFLLGLPMFRAFFFPFFIVFLVCKRRQKRA